MSRKFCSIIAAFLVCTLIMSCFMITYSFAEDNEENISIDMREADIRDILSAIAVNLNKSIIYTGQPMTVSFSIQDVNPREAFEYFLNTVGMNYIEDGKLLIIGYRDTLNNEFYNKISLSKFVLKHVDSDVISTQIEMLGIPVKKITLDSNKKVIFVHGLPQELSMVNQLISMLDRPENASEQPVPSTPSYLAPITTKYIDAYQLNDIIGQMGMNRGIVVESNPMTLWVYGDNSAIARIQEVQKKFDIPENHKVEKISLTSVKLQYLTADEIIPILNELNANVTTIYFNRRIQTLWLNGSEDSIKLATDIIKRFDVKENINDNIFFVFKTVNITARELMNRFEKLDLKNVEIDCLDYPEFSKSVIVHCPADYKILVANQLEKLDVLTEKIKVPVDYSDVPGGMSKLAERRKLLSELTGIPETSFTITNNVSRNDGYLFVMYLEETSENIKRVKDYITYIDDPLSDGISN